MDHALEQRTATASDTQRADKVEYDPAELTNAASRQHRWVR